jgi:hypothetical protein
VKKHHRRETSIDTLLRNSFQAGAPTGPGPCVDPEMIAAWTEGRLPAREAAAVEAHLAGCASCQEVLAVFARTETESVGPAVPGFGWIRWRWAVPVAVAATAAAIWVAVRDRDGGVDEFERRVAPAIETTQAPANPPAATDAVAPSPSPPPIVRPPESPAPSFADRADKQEQDATQQAAKAKPDVKEEAAEGFAARQAAAPALRDTAAPAAPAAPPPPAAASAPPPAAQDQARVRAEQRVDLLRQAPTTEAVGTGGLRWRIVPRGRLERSLDFGQTWQTVTLPQGIEVTGVRAADNSAIVTTADGRQFRTDDRGATWTAVQP